MHQKDHTSGCCLGRSWGLAGTGGCSFGGSCVGTRAWAGGGGPALAGATIGLGEAAMGSGWGVGLALTAGAMAGMQGGDLCLLGGWQQEIHCGPGAAY